MDPDTTARHPGWDKVYAELDRRPGLTGSLPAFLDRVAGQYGDATALTDEDGRRTTYEQLRGAAARFAAAATARGVEHGDRVAVMLPNVTEYAVALFGVLRAGGTVVQVNPIYVRRELEHMLATTGARVVVTSVASLGSVREVVDGGSTDVDTVVVVGGEDLATGEVSFDDLLDEAADEAPLPAVDPASDLASIQFTGGTTGRSKGAMLTHSNLLWGIQPTLDLLLPGDADALPAGGKAVAAAPFFHIFGLTMVLLAGLHHGLELLLVPRPRPDDLVTLIRDERPVYLAGVATLFVALENHPDADTAGYEHVRLYTSGGASVPSALLAAFERRSGRTLYEGYGMSEGAPATFNTHVRGSVAGSIGVPIPGVEIRIVGEDGEDVGPGDRGELLLRGPQVMQGYWGMPEETAAALTDDGWLRTGDVATVDDDGWIRIVDRIKDMINAAGYKVYPREVEDVVHELGVVVEAAVTSAPDEYRGETVKLVVVLRDGVAPDEAAIDRHCRERLAAYKVPRIIEFRDELPKSTVGKILRREL